MSKIDYSNLKIPDFDKILVKLRSFDPKEYFKEVRKKKNRKAAIISLLLSFAIVTFLGFILVRAVFIEDKDNSVGDGVSVDSRVIEDSETENKTVFGKLVDKINPFDKKDITIPTPTIANSENSNNGGQNTDGSSYNTPTPTPFAQNATATPTVKLTATTTPTTKLTSTPTLMPTNSPTPTTEVFPQRMANMYPQGSYNPGASGKTYLQKIKQSTNGYNDYRVWGEYYNLTANRTHKIYVCDSGGGCSSSNDFYITTNASGFVSFDEILYGHNDNYLINTIRIWQDYSGEIPPADPTICPFVSIDSNACLKGNL